jgi:hypothetical protein
MCKEEVNLLVHMKCPVQQESRHPALSARWLGVSVQNDAD